MPNLTTKIGLKKPLSTEAADISVINENMDIIDASVPSLGKDNTSVNLVKALTLEVDTRTLETTRDVSGNITSVSLKNGTTAVKIITVNRTNGDITGFTSAAGGKTVTYTVNRNADGTINTVPKAVN